jgi:hypothetical protein
VERDAAKADFGENALDCRQAVHSRRLHHDAVTSHKSTSHHQHTCTHHLST